MQLPFIGPYRVWPVRHEGCRYYPANAPYRVRKEAMRLSLANLLFRAQAHVFGHGNFSSLRGVTSPPGCRLCPACRWRVPRE